MGELVLFFSLAVMVIITSVGVVATSNPVRSALLLVVNFFVLAMLYVMLHAHFLAVVQVIVYTGAIMVLFLFVIMLLNLGSPEVLREPAELKRPFALLLGLALLALLGAQVFAAIGAPPATAPVEVGKVEQVGVALFSQWAFPFEVVSLLLLVGIVGSILLAKRRI